MARAIPTVLLFCLLALWGCSAPTGRGSETVNRASFEAIRVRLSSVRALKFASEVPIVMKTRERAASHIDVELRQLVRGRKQEDISLAYSKLGLLPQGTDLRSTLLKFYSSQASAFYDSKENKIVLIESPEGGANPASSPEIDDRIIAHELTHALQDQAFLVGERLRSESNSDAAMALRAVAEGDAFVSEHAYAFGALDEWLPGYVLQLLESGATDSILPNIPALVTDRSQFQYRAGARFVSRFLSKSDWSLVNRLYTHPPLSTEQVLHPEKYFEAPDPPTRVEFGSLSSLFPSEWEKIESDTLGELSIQCLFNQWHGPNTAAAVATGWDGDRFVAYRNGHEVAFIWATVWDSSEDAGEFYEGYQKLLSIKYDTPLTDSRFYVEKRDRTVIVVEGLERDRVKKHIESIWVELTTEKESLQPAAFRSMIGNR